MHIYVHMYVFKHALLRVEFKNEYTTKNWLQFKAKVKKLHAPSGELC